ncbi:MAG: 5-(carboxyamino)imidazole ribonucleotide synthase [Myxococcales bacterium]|nr:5-(carboxyamino)imidazole ribonucleotide synthase [Polyangiaceae bacterium]MDW8250936.1 5-(carboxyamino)imidazole ribonucleotide synthase [Myxococcales bacterium]
MSLPILPGSTIGVLGGGQLGRMFALAARRMGYRVHSYSPELDTPTGQVANMEVTAPYEDLDRIRSFASGVHVISFEFENVPSPTVAAAAEVVPVRPGGHVLHTTQQRLREKTFLRGAGFPVTPFVPIHGEEDFAAAGAIGFPAILKLAAFGYDGKGQTRVERPEDLPGAWQRLGAQEAILEALVDFSCEVSVVAARGVSGEFAHHGVVENHHRNHILDLSIAPARIPPALAAEAVELARAVLECLDVIGVLCVEFFVTRSGSLLINELAPRPHNSGHFSFDASLTSQFEQQLRAVCGLPLGSTEQLRPAAMVNLLGDLWADGEPRWAEVYRFPQVKLHLYGKTEARPGRKMGHLTALAATVDEAVAQVLAARDALRP